MAMCKTILPAIVLICSLVVVHGDNPSFSCIEDTLCNLCKKRDCSKVESMSDLQAKLDKHDKDIQDLQGKHSTVAFFAYLGANLRLNSVSKGKIITYDQVNLNLGNGYDKTTGLFTAPSEGTYMFYVATGTFDRSHASVELVQNGTVKDVAWSDAFDHDDREFTTTATPLSLKKGDVVNARIGQAFGGNALESNQNIRCSFSGFKIN